MGLVPRVAGPDRAQLLFRVGLHRVRDSPVRERSAEDDAAAVDERVHVRGVLLPAALLLEREFRIELGARLPQDDVEPGHGYNSYTNIRGRPGFDVVDPSG